MPAYYNENNPAAVHVLRCLINDGVIAPGVVDDRSIKDVRAHEIGGFNQYHWFAGGGLWSVSTRIAGWYDERPFWSASCPCKPYSQAGKRGGADDPRNLWPDLYRIIREAKRFGFAPAVLVGEQVAGKDGYHWFNGVRLDLAREGYRARAVDIPSCAVNAPHQRSREYWVALADAESVGSGRNVSGWRPEERSVDRRLDAWGRPVKPICEYFSACHDPNACIGRFATCPYRDEPPAGFEWSDDDGWIVVNASRVGRSQGRTDARILGRLDAATSTDLFGPLADAASIGRQMAGDAKRFSGSGSGGAVDRGARSNGDDRSPLDYPERTGREGLGRHGAGTPGWSRANRSVAAPVGGDVADRDGFATRFAGNTGSEESTGSAYGHNHDGRNYWSDAEWIVCHDGKARRTKPGIRLLVNGLPGRVDLWSIAGNAINPQAAAEVIKALMDVLPHGL